MVMLVDINCVVCKTRARDISKISARNYFSMEIKKTRVVGRDRQGGPG
jgi:hypothetical protein